MAFSAPLRPSFPPLEPTHVRNAVPFTHSGAPNAAPVAAHSNSLSAQLDPQRAEEQLTAFAQTNPVAFEAFVGLYFQESGRLPYDVGKQQSPQLCCQGWLRNPRVLDILTNGGTVGKWEVSADDLFLIFGKEIAHNLFAFEAAILRWAINDDKTGGHNVVRVLRKAGFIPMMEMPYTSEWMIMDSIFKMAEGEEKERKIRMAQKESPLLFQYCLKDIWCGRLVPHLRRLKGPGPGSRLPYTSPPRGVNTNRFGPFFRVASKRKCVDAPFEDVTVVVHHTPRGREETIIEPRPKRIKMSAARPMQVHNVPLEERAFDSKGNRLPWALEWPELVTLEYTLLTSSDCYIGDIQMRGAKSVTLKRKVPLAKRISGKDRQEPEQQHQQRKRTLL